MAYTQRYAGGFVDLPTKTTPIDSTYLNNVETALLALFGVAPTTNGALVWDGAKFTAAALLKNAQIDPSAAIAKSKLDLTGANGIVDADVASAAAIARSKLNFGSGLVNADIAAAAAIALSKIAVGGTSTQVVRGDGSLATPGVQLICSSVAGSAVASFDTNTILGGNIPATYSHLKVILSGRGDNAALQVAVGLRLNNDSGSNYDTHSGILGSTYSQSASNGATSGDIGAFAANNATAGAIGQTEVLIANYAGSTLRKNVTSQSGGKQNVDGSGQYELRANGFEWRSTAAVTRLSVFPSSGNFMAGSAFYLYGVN